MVMSSGNWEELTSLDRLILNVIQSNFPLSPRPFRIVAEKVGSTEEEVLERVRLLKERKIIRRLGGVFDSHKMGFVSTLVALQVLPERIEQVAEEISDLPGVTHNYQRDHLFNLWFTLTCPSDEALEKALDAIEALPGVIKLLRFPALQTFKIGVNLPL